MALYMELLRLHWQYCGQFLAQKDIHRLEGYSRGHWMVRGLKHVGGLHKDYKLKQRSFNFI